MWQGLWNQAMPHIMRRYLQFKQGNFKVFERVF